MMKKLHIGELIERQTNLLKITNKEFADRLNCHRTSVNYMFKQESIDLHRLLDVSDILNYDFIGRHFCSKCASTNGPEIMKIIEMSNKELEMLSYTDKRIVIEIKLQNEQFVK